MNRWMWIAVGAAGAAVLVGRRRRSSGATRLGSPIEASGMPAATPHGHFGADRTGPPFHYHQGVDLVARPGSLVLAVGDGVIVSTEPGLGKVVRKLKLDTPSAWTDGGDPIVAVVYADLGTPLVEPGDRVRECDAIATVAKAGFVHFAIKTKEGHSETFIDPKQAGFAYRSRAQEVSPWLV
jgi:murein DD-endopeptidase MepM/ murein hydrolase activator NlpD